MYTLTHDGEIIGVTQLERGDPSELSVSGAVNNFGGAKAMAAWIKSIGGEEDNGVIFIALNGDFSLLDQAGTAIKISEGHLMAVPDEDGEEVFIDITLPTEKDYKSHFSAHMLAMENDS